MFSGSGESNGMSRGTRKADQGSKRRVYAKIGVREYRQYDPTGDYLVPPLKGLRWEGGRYARMPLGTADGVLQGRSEVMGLKLRVEQGRLRFRDPLTGEYLPSSEELEARVAELKARLRGLRDP